jgi:hypothetical protein
MMQPIFCGQCREIIAYTNRILNLPKFNYLTSDKLSVNQKGAFIDRRKLIYCKKCYDKEVKPDLNKDMFNNYARYFK